MVNRSSLFVESVADWNSATLLPIVGVLFDLYKKQDAARGSKRPRIDWSVNSDQFLSELLNIYRRICGGRIMPPNREEIMVWLEKTFNVSICPNTYFHWQNKSRGDLV